MRKRFIAISIVTVGALTLAPLPGTRHSANAAGAAMAKAAKNSNLGTEFSKENWDQHNNKTQPAKLLLAQSYWQESSEFIEHGYYDNDRGRLRSLSPPERIAFDRLGRRQRHFALTLPPPQFHAFLRLRYRDRLVFMTLPPWERVAFLALTPRERGWFVSLPPRQRVAFLYLSPEQMSEFITLAPPERQEVLSLPSDQYYAFFSLAPTERHHFFSLRPNERQRFISSRAQAPREAEKGQPQRLKPGAQTPAGKTAPQVPATRERERGRHTMKPNTHASGAAAPQPQGTREREKGMQQHGQGQLTPGSNMNASPHGENAPNFQKKGPAGTGGQ